MDEFWNRRELISPAFKTIPTKIKRNDLNRLSQTIRKFFVYLQSQEKFDTAAAYLSRIIFINGPQFRRMHGFLAMKQVNQALIRLKNLGLHSTVETFSAFACHEIYQEQAMVHLPTRQNLEFLLVKMQGAAKLLCRVIERVERSSEYLLKLLAMGNFFSKNAIFLSNLGEIWALSKAYLNELATFYAELRPKMDLLESGRKLWLPKSYVLPTDLKSWIGDDWPVATRMSNLESIKRENKAFNLLNLGEDEDVMLSSEPSTTTPANLTLVRPEEEFEAEVIDRSSLKQNTNKKKKKRLK